MIKVIQANKDHKEIVLKLLDEFIFYYRKLIYPDEVSEPHINNGKLFDKFIESNSLMIFIAQENEKNVGIVTVNIIPQLRYDRYSAEIEDLFVFSEYHGKGVAQKLIDNVISWCKDRNCKFLRLESHDRFERAHAFYIKQGFKQYGKAFEMDL